MQKALLELEINEQLPESEWITITQDMINRFAEATEDFQWIHVDPERCAKHSPFDSTIAHGYFTVTLMPNSLYQSIRSDPKYPTLLNYGVDKIRFIEPVRVNDKIRFSSVLINTEQKPAGRLFYFETTAEIAGRDKPAMKGVFLMLLVGAS